MGTGAFVFASRFSGLGILGTGLLGPGPTLYCLLLRLYKECKYKRKNGHWCKKEGSRVLNQDGTIMWKSAIPVAVNILTNGGYLLAMSLGWKFAKAAGLN